MESVMEKITPRTKAVLPVHLFGQTCKLELIKDELSQRGIALIEDCAQAIGAHRMIDKKICRAGAMGIWGVSHSSRLKTSAATVTEVWYPYLTVRKAPNA
jgi:dTDP-4-amino-4,6-dideoxygalactose transaminase